MGLRSCSSLQEGEAVLADLELVAVAQLGGLHPLAVEERPVEAALVFEAPALAVLREDRVLARDRDVVEEDAALGRAADRRRALLERERLPRAAAAGANDERGA